MSNVQKATINTDYSYIAPIFNIAICDHVLSLKIHFNYP